MTELLPRAFAALGQGPTARELELVADTLVAAGETAALEAAAADHEAFVVLAELASSAGCPACGVGPDYAGHDRFERCAVTGTAPTETVEIEGFGPVTVRGLSKDRIKQISRQAVKC